MCCVSLPFFFFFALVALWSLVFMEGEMDAEIKIRAECIHSPCICFQVLLLVFSVSLASVGFLSRGRQH